MSATSKTHTPNHRTITRRVAAAVVGVAVAAVNLMQACGFAPAAALQTPADVYAFLDASAYVDETDAERWTVTDVPGQLRVEHGSSCASASQAASSQYVGLRILDHDVLPANYDGTVFMNGWHLEYRDGDHHVVGLGSTLFNIVQLNDTLVWDAGGVLSDNNGDDAYKWCYSYTVLAWPRNLQLKPRDMNLLRPHMEISVVHADQSGKLMFVDGSSAGALHSIPGSFKSKGAVPSAVLLAGFGQSFTDDDHHILQIGFDLGTAKERDVKKAHKLKWTSQTILKDNDSERPQRSAEIVSILSGASVHVTHPATTILEEAEFESPGPRSNDVQLSPRASRSCPAQLGYGGTFTYSYSIPNLPYTYAIPMLTGWDLDYPCDDAHVKHVGAWIDDFAYVKEAGGLGTLSYTVRVEMGDEDDFPGVTGQVQVDVLGIDQIVPVNVGRPIDNPVGAPKPVPPKPRGVVDPGAKS